MKHTGSCRHLASPVVQKLCLCVQAVDEACGHAALACEGSELGIWDLQQQQRSYHAKGGKPNKIRLVDKPHNTAVAFLAGSLGQRLLVGTAFHKLRLYDLKSRRPALDLSFGEAKITAVAPQGDGKLKPPWQVLSRHSNPL